MLLEILFISLMEHVTEMINHFPSMKRTETELSPAEIVDGVAKINMAHNQILFGTYAEVWDGTTNIMRDRSIPCIRINRCNNTGGFYFMSVETGKRHHSNQWKEIPITRGVINQVENLTKKSSY